jgi:steroid 5-alpha reductase family enzyme
MSPVQVNLISTLAITLALTVLTFGVAVRRGRYDTIDSGWGLGFAVIAVVSFGLASGSLVSRHIHSRNRGRPEDSRYVTLLAKGGRGRMFVRVYLVQGVLLWVVSLPVQVGQYGGGPGVLGWFGVLGWAVGLTFEAVGDLQLRRFKASPSNEGRVLDTGLWRYTRHPNYFGDACVWWGLYLLACHSWAGAATVIAPLVMTALLAKGSGKPMLEKDMLARRPAYADYARRTSGFLPLRPKAD